MTPMIRYPALSSLPALVALALPAALAAAGGPWSEQKEARVRLVSRWAEAPAGADAGLGLEFQLQPGWHVYWKNAGDAGYPPKIVFAATGAIAGGELLYPAPERFVLPGELMSFGYEKEVVYPIDARLEPAAGSPAPLRAKLDYLVCAESCIPYRTELTLELPVGAAREDPEIASRIAAWRARLPSPAAATGSPRATGRLEVGPGSELTLVVTLGGEGLGVAAPDVFFAVHPQAELGTPRFVADREGPGFRVPLRPLDPTRPLPETLAFDWTATGFTLAGREVALTGRLDLARPAPPAATPAALSLRVAIALGVVLFVVLALRRLRAARTAPPTTA